VPGAPKRPFTIWVKTWFSWKTN